MASSEDIEVVGTANDPSEATAVVFGMPKEAYIRGWAEKLTPVDKIPVVIKEYFEGMN
jgi:chemotaxis response regulator CheB